MMNYWGKHYLADCANCDRDLISDRTNIKLFSAELVKKIGMKAYGDPIIEHFATHDPEKGGYTLAQMIETSLIDGHFVDINGDAYISVHSCMEFDTEIVKTVINEYFNPESIKDHTIYRKA